VAAGRPVGPAAVERARGPGLRTTVGGPSGPATAGGGAHRVRPGESLWEIAQQAYGDGRLWPVVLRDNRGAIGNPNLMFVGQNLQLPALPTEEVRRLLRRVEHVAA
jgi:5'-nucleotidase / UDP-sugar diphosphatase